MHRLDTFLQMALLDDLSQCPDNIGFGVLIHGQVRTLPVTKDTQSFKIFALFVDLLMSILTTGVSKCTGINFVASLTDFFLDH